MTNREQAIRDVAVLIYGTFQKSDIVTIDRLTRFDKRLQFEVAQREKVLELTAALEQTRKDRQSVVSAWGVRAFGAEQTNSIPQRGLRLLEESAETAQSAGVTREMARMMIDYVFSRPVGELAQELGGVGICVLALAQAAGLDADKCEVDELNRVLAKPIEHFTKRNQAKNDAGFLAVKKVGCEREDGTLNIHTESEFCDVCRPVDHD